MKMGINVSQIINRLITIHLEPREDGGLRIYSDDLPGLVLSGPDQEAVLSDMDTAIIELAKHMAGRS